MRNIYLTDGTAETFLRQCSTHTETPMLFSALRVLCRRHWKIALFPYFLQKINPRESSKKSEV